METFNVLFHVDPEGSKEEGWLTDSFKGVGQIAFPEEASDAHVLQLLWELVGAPFDPDSVVVDSRWGRVLVRRADDNCPIFTLYGI